MVRKFDVEDSFELHYQHQMNKSTNSKTVEVQEMLVLKMPLHKII